MDLDTIDSTSFVPLHSRFKLRAHRWLSLAVAPSFALLALLNQNHAGMPTLCAALQDRSPLSGMVPMYVLMSVVHVTPWLRLFSRRRGLREPC